MQNVSYLPSLSLLAFNTFRMANLLAAWIKSTGKVRGVLQAETRAREAQTLGFKKLILPASNKKGLEKLLGMRVVGVKNLDEALDELF